VSYDEKGLHDGRRRKMIDGGALIVDETDGPFREIWSHVLSAAYHCLTFLYDSVNGNQCKGHMTKFPIDMLTHLLITFGTAAVIIGLAEPIVDGVFVVYSLNLRRLLDILRSV
jgi:hypothetical protein